MRSEDHAQVVDTEQSGRGEELQLKKGKLVWLFLGKIQDLETPKKPWILTFSAFHIHIYFF